MIEKRERKQEIFCHTSVKNSEIHAVLLDLEKDETFFHTLTIHYLVLIKMAIPLLQFAPIWLQRRNFRRIKWKRALGGLIYGLPTELLGLFVYVILISNTFIVKLVIYEKNVT